MLPKINKLKNVRAKNLALRLFHGDIYTGTRLLNFGMATNDECTKCRQSETLKHLLTDCWYSGAIWTKITELYKKTDQRRQAYQNKDITFAIGSRLSFPKLTLHIEIIRRLTNKDRPNLSPKNLISQALDHLMICDLQYRKYYKKLKRELN